MVRNVCFISTKKNPTKFHRWIYFKKKIPVLECYFDNSRPIFHPIVFEKDIINRNIDLIKEKKTLYYEDTDLWLYEALEKYPIYNKKVVIIGSETPWYESIVLAYGGHPITIEYNTLLSKDPRVKVMRVEEYEKNPCKFDVILSVSSIEHDGLGRYGDPINPWGDIEFMKKATSMLKKEGLFYLGIPIGKDCLTWNAHRIYGKIRLPMLLKHWKKIDTFGMKNSDFSRFALGHWKHQPIFVLKRKR